MATDCPLTLLDRWTAPTDRRPNWRFIEVDNRFLWLLDGDRGVVLVDRQCDSIELRCHGPEAWCPPAVVPTYYHTPTYEGVRLIWTWRLRSKGCGERLTTTTEWAVKDNRPILTCTQTWSDGTISRSEAAFGVDRERGVYIATINAELEARRVTTALEFCNVLPAGIGDSRPDRERFPVTFWRHPEGLRRLLKNPLWFCSVGAQDMAGEKRIAERGFVAFGPDDRLNPAIELLDCDPPVGMMTCDGLQDEHLMALPATGRQATATGWHRLHARYRCFSLPKAVAEALIAEARPITPGAMLAWKFQYPAIPELPRDLTRVELPGSPYIGASDWSRPVSWDAPYNGLLWTPSPDPAALIHYDRATGRERPGSIRLRANGEAPLRFGPGSGHSLHLDAGIRYRFTIWIKAQEGARGWLAAYPMLYSLGDRPPIESPVVQAVDDWRQVEATVTGVGDEAPFCQPLLCASGNGNVWFTDLTIGPLG